MFISSKYCLRPANYIRLILCFLCLYDRKYSTRYLIANATNTSLSFIDLIDGQKRLLKKKMRIFVHQFKINFRLKVISNG